MPCKTHFCCGEPMEKVSGTKSTYRCSQCGKTQNPNKKITFGDIVIGRKEKTKEQS